MNGLKGLVDFLYNRAQGLKTGICALVVLIYISITVYSGGRIGEMVLLLAFLCGYIYLPGRFWTDLLKADRRFLHLRFGTDILLGTGFFVFLYCISMRLGIKVLLAALPLVISAVYIADKLRKKENIISLSALTPDSWLLVLLYFALLLFYTFNITIKNALPASVGSTLLNQDILWNVGNANAFKLRFMPEEIRYSGVQLHYHFLTEMFAGAISWVSGISTYNIITFYLAPYLLICVVKCLYSLGLTSFEEKWKAMLFTYSMFLFGCGSLWGCFLSGRSLFFNDNAYHIITNVNAQGTAVIFLSVYVAMFFQMMDRGKDIKLLQIVLWLAAFFMLSFGKGPVAAIVAVGTVIVLIWLFIQKKVDIKFAFSGLVLGAMFFVVYKFFFSSGANTSMVLSTFATVERTIWGDWLRQLYIDGRVKFYNYAKLGVALANTFMVAPAQVFLYAVGLTHDVPRLFKLDGRRLFLNSQIAGGIIAFYIFNHYALSQVYFLFLAIFCLSLLAVDNIRFVKDKHLVKGLAFFCAAIGFTTQCFMYTNFIGSGGRALVRNFGWDEKPHYVCEMTPDDQLSMEFYGQNTAANSLFATNRIHTAYYTADGISNVYSALSGRQGYMEGYAYALTNMGVPYYVITQRQDINNVLFSEDSTPEEIRCLCDATGITHLIFSTQFDGSDKVIGTMFEKIYDSPTVRIYATGSQPMSPHPLYQPELAQYGEGIKE